MRHTTKITFLSVPENSENEADALLHFTAEFSSRWEKYQVLFT